MRIGIYVFSVTPEWGGVFQYAERLVQVLAKHSRDEVVVFTSTENDSYFKELLEGKGKTVVLGSHLGSAPPEAAGGGRRNTARQLAKRALSLFPPGYEAVRRITQKHRGHRANVESDVNKRLMVQTIRESCDVVHFPFQTMDGYEHVLAFPSLITLHDLQHRYYPQFFDQATYEWRERAYPSASKACTRVIVSFTHVKSDIVAFYGIDAGKIDVCGIGYSPQIVPNEETVMAARVKYGISGSYLIYTAATWEHKNHLGLLRAFREMLDATELPITLVCTGNKTDFFKTIETEIERLGLEGKARFLGYLPAEDAAALVAGAALAVIPTLYEAGSYPLMEAMALRVPAICSNVTALPEQMGDDRFLFDPRNTHEMSALMAAMLSDEKLREECVANGIKRARDNEPERKVGAFLDSYRKAVADYRR